MGTAYSHAARHGPHETLPLKSARGRYVMSRGRLARPSAAPVHGRLAGGAADRPARAGPLLPCRESCRRQRGRSIADDRKAQLSFAFCQIHYLNWYFTIYRSRKSTWGVDARAPKRTRDTMTLNPRLRMLQPCPLQRQQPVRLSFARNHADDERIARGGNAQSFLPVLPV